MMSSDFPPRTTKTSSKDSTSDSDDEPEYTDDEEKPLTALYRTLKPSTSATELSQYGEKSSLHSKHSDASSSEDDSDSEFSDSDFDAPGTTRMNDPFGFGDSDPFAMNNQPIWRPDVPVMANLSGTFDTITQAKQRILVCCRDLRISEENAIRYPDLQKIYKYRFGTTLDKDELNKLFTRSSASDVLTKDFGTYLNVKLARDTEDKVMKMTAKSDIRDAVHLLENSSRLSAVFGILEPLPELPMDEVEGVLKKDTRFGHFSAAPNFMQGLRPRDVMDLRNQGFAKENFADMPKVRNPIMKDVIEDGSDEFTGDENEIGCSAFVSLKPRKKFVKPADPNFGRRVPLKSACESPSFARSSTSSLKNNASWTIKPRRGPQRIHLNNERYKGNTRDPRFDDDSDDVWSGEDEDWTAQFSYREPVGPVLREKLNVTTQSNKYNPHKEDVFSDQEEEGKEILQYPSHGIDITDEKNEALLLALREAQVQLEKKKREVQNESVLVKSEYMTEEDVEKTIKEKLNHCRVHRGVERVVMWKTEFVDVVYGYDFGEAMETSQMQPGVGEQLDDDFREGVIPDQEMLPHQPDEQVQDDVEGVNHDVEFDADLNEGFEEEGYSSYESLGFAGKF